MTLTMDTVKAWKDWNYRESLTAEQQTVVPESPVGLVELTDEELGALDVSGACMVDTIYTGKDTICESWTTGLFGLCCPAWCW